MDNKQNLAQINKSFLCPITPSSVTPNCLQSKLQIHMQLASTLRKIKKLPLTSNTIAITGAN